MGIKTEYRGYEIRYSENEDAWRCDVVKDSKASLSKMKQAIDRMHLKMRKEAATDSAILRIHNGFSLTACSIVEYLGEKWSRGGYGSAREPKFEGHRVAVVAERDGREKAARSEERLENLVKLGPEADAAIEKAKTSLKKVREAEEIYRADIAAIPRLTIQDISKIVDASDARLEEPTA